MKRKASILTIALLLTCFSLATPPVSAKTDVYTGSIETSVDLTRQDTIEYSGVKNLEIFIDFPTSYSVVGWNQTVRNLNVAFKPQSLQSDTIEYTTAGVRCKWNELPGSGSLEMITTATVDLKSDLSPLSSIATYPIDPQELPEDVKEFLELNIESNNPVDTEKISCDAKSSYKKQEKGWSCGPTASAQLLRDDWGFDIEWSEIAKKTNYYKPGEEKDHESFQWGEAEKFLKELGFKSAQFHQVKTLDKLKEIIQNETREKRSVLLSTMLGGSKGKRGGHVIRVTRFEDSTFKGSDPRGNFNFQDGDYPHKLADTPPDEGKAVTYKLDDLEKYLKKSDGRYWVLTTGEPGEKVKLLAKITNIVNWLAEHHIYDPKVKIDSALEIFEQFERTGFLRCMCGGLANAAVALLTSDPPATIGIPARVVRGIVYDTGKKDSLWGNGTHAWIEVYYPDLGWVPYDPQVEKGFIDTQHIKLSLEGKCSGGYFSFKETHIDCEVNSHSDGSRLWYTSPSPRSEHMRARQIGEKEVLITITPSIKSESLAHVSAQLSPSFHVGTVTLQYSTDQTNWKNIASGEPKEGRYSTYWTLPGTGDFYFRAEWSGDDFYDPEVSTVETVIVPSFRESPPSIALPPPRYVNTRMWESERYKSSFAIRLTETGIDYSWAGPQEPTWVEDEQRWTWQGGWEGKPAEESFELEADLGGLGQGFSPSLPSIWTHTWDVGASERARSTVLKNFESALYELTLDQALDKQEVSKRLQKSMAEAAKKLGTPYGGTEVKLSIDERTIWAKYHGLSLPDALKMEACRTPSRIVGFFVGLLGF